jgi:dihydropteroate synthase
MYWQTTRHRIALQLPLVMGIVNATPDSFSDGGLHADAPSAQAHCDRLVTEGAHILDIGGESTRPGARQPTLQEELARVLPVLRHAVTLGVPVSVDTSRPAVMQAALDLGVDIVNDVRALREPGALAVVAAHPACGVCLMHMQGEPGVMQQAPHYDGEVVDAVNSWLRQRLADVRAAGVAAERIALDPGIGFGKTPAHNWALLQRQQDLVAIGRPLLVGWSRKSTLGWLTGAAGRRGWRPAWRRPCRAVQAGAHLLRVHDVAATVDGLKCLGGHDAASTMNPSSSAIQGLTP